MLTRLYDIDSRENRRKPAMSIRPRTARTMKLKKRRCPKCGCHLNPQRKRCKVCAKKLV